MIVAVTILVVVSSILLYSWLHHADAARRAAGLGRVGTHARNLIELCSTNETTVERSVSEYAYIRLLEDGLGPCRVFRYSLRHLRFARELIIEAGPLSKETAAMRDLIELEFAHACIRLIPARIEAWAGKMVPVHYVYGRRLVWSYAHLAEITETLCDELRPDLSAK